MAKNNKIDNNNPSNVGSDVIDVAISNALSILLTGKNTNNAADVKSIAGTNVSIFSALDSIKKSTDNLAKAIVGDLVAENEETEKNTITSEINKNNISNISKNVGMLSKIFIYKFDEIYNILDKINSTLLNIDNKKTSKNNINNTQNNDKNFNVNVTGNSMFINDINEFLQNISSVKFNINKVNATIESLTKFFNISSQISSNKNNNTKIDLSWLTSIFDVLDKIKLSNVITIKYKLFLMRRFLLKDLIGFQNYIILHIKEKNKKSKEFQNEFDSYVIENIFSIFDKINDINKINIIKYKYSLLKLKAFIINDIVGLSNYINEKSKNNDSKGYNILNTINSLIENIITIGEKRKIFNRGLNEFKGLEKSIQLIVDNIINSISKLNELQNKELKKENILNKIKDINEIIKSISDLLKDIYIMIGIAILATPIIIISAPLLITSLILIGSFILGTLKIIDMITNNNEILKNESLKNIDALATAIAKLTITYLFVSMISKVIGVGGLKGLLIISSAITGIIALVKYVGNLKIDKSLKSIDLLTNALIKITLLVTGVSLISMFIKWEDIIKSFAILITSVIIIGKIAVITSKLKKVNEKTIDNLIKYTGALMLLSVALVLVGKLLSITDILLGGLTLLISITIIGFIFSLLSSNELQKAIKDGAKTALILTGAFALSILLMSYAISELVKLNQYNIMDIIVGGVIIVATLFVFMLLIKGLSKLIETGKGALIIFGAIAVLIAIPIIIMLMVYAIEQFINLLTIINNIEIPLIDILIKVGKLILIGIIMGFGFSMIGLVGILALPGIFIAIKLFNGITELIPMLNKLNEIPEINASNIIKSFLIFAGISLALIQMTPILISALPSIAIIGAMGLSLSLLARGISKFAIMQFPTKYDKDGNVIESVTLTETDIENTSKNISNVLTTVIDAISNVADLHPELLKREYGIFGNTPIEIFLSSSVKIGEMIANLATGVQAFANLKYPTKYDSKGRPIEYVNFNDAEKNKAIENIKTVLTTVIDAIKGLMNSENADMFKENWFTSSPYSTFMKSSTKLGKMISNLATGVQSFANLTYPIEYDANGKPIKFKNFNEEDKNKAIENIRTVSTTVVDAINGLIGGIYSDMFKENWFTNSPYSVFMKSSTKLGEMVANLATGVQAFANLTYPTAWDENGKPIAFSPIDENFDNIKTNIGNILTTVISAIKGLMNGENADMFKDNWFENSPLRIFLENSQNIGLMVSGLAEGVKGFATLSIPSKFDSNGKPIEYFNASDTAFDQVGTNINKVMTTIFTGITDVLNGPNANVFESDYFKDPKFKTFMDNAKNIGGLLSGLATGIKSFSELKFSDEYDDKLNPKGTPNQLSESSFVTAANTIQKVLTTIFSAIANVLNDEKISDMLDGGWFGNGGSFDKLMKNSESINKLLVSSAKTVSMFSWAGILPADVDKNGNVTKYIKYNLDNVRINIDNVLKTILNKISEFITENEETIDKSDTFVEKLTKVSNINNKLIEIIPNFTKIIESLNKITIDDYFNSVLPKKISVINALIKDINSISTEVNTILINDNIINKFDNFFNNVSEKIDKLSEFDSNTLDTNAKVTKEYIKSINTLDISKTDKLITLSKELNKLSGNMGNVQTVLDTFVTKMTFIINKLIKNLAIVENSIKQSDKIQDRRKNIIKNTIDEIKELMEQKIEVQISSDTADTEISPSMSTSNLSDSTNIQNTQQPVNTGINPISQNNFKPMFTNTPFNKNNNNDDYSLLISLLGQLLNDNIVIKTKNV